MCMEDVPPFDCHIRKQSITFSLQREHPAMILNKIDKIEKKLTSLYMPQAAYGKIF